MRVSAQVSAWGFHYKVKCYFYRTEGGGCNQCSQFFFTSLINFFGSFSSPTFSKYRALCLFYVLLRLNAWCYAVKYEEQSVHSCRFVHHAKLHRIMTTLNRLFKIEIQRGGTGKKPYLDSRSVCCVVSSRVDQCCSYQKSCFLYRILSPLSLVCFYTLLDEGLSTSFSMRVSLQG